MALRIDFVSLFPEMVLPGLRHSILARAERDGHVALGAVSPRDFATDAHRTVDAKPFGGGPGMLLMCGPIDAALTSLEIGDGCEVVFTEPHGERFDQSLATELSRSPRIVFVCGHYEGIDHRMQLKWATRTVSLGDFILTGGELAAMTMADAIVRQIPGVLGDGDSLVIDSLTDGLLSAPQYTRPAEFEGCAVPNVLTAGDHSKIAEWKRRESLRLTRAHRPDLFSRAPLRRTDLGLLED